MSKQYILFDLDGTLTDSRIGIVKSIRYSLEYFGIHVSDLNELTHFVGPSLFDSYLNAFDLSEKDATEAVAKYREYYVQKGIFENTLYAGAADMLKQLSDAGKTLAIATSKPTVYTGDVLDHFQIRDYFTFVSGSELTDKHIDKGQIIKKALDRLTVSNPAEAVMVGDRHVDIIGAKENGIESIGAVYGYGGQKELTAAGADDLADDIAALSGLLSRIE